MEKIKEEQVEALRAVIDYNKRLLPALNEIVIELKEEQKEDTNEYLNHILKGVNWVIQVFNGTSTLLNQNENCINKEEINQSIIALNRQMNTNDNEAIANIIETSITPFIETMTEIATKIVED